MLHNARPAATCLQRTERTPPDGHAKIQAKSRTARPQLSISSNNRLPCICVYYRLRRTTKAVAYPASVCGSDSSNLLLTVDNSHNSTLRQTAPPAVARDDLTLHHIDAHQASQTAPLPLSTSSASSPFPTAAIRRLPAPTITGPGQPHASTNALCSLQAPDGACNDSSPARPANNASNNRIYLAAETWRTTPRPACRRRRLTACPAI